MCTGKVKVRIAYDGSALSDGTMDVRDLAPALMAYANFIVRANQVIGNEAPVNVKLRADDVHKGSFDLVLEVAQSLLGQAKSLFKIAENTGLKDLSDLIGIGETLGGTVVSIFAFVLMVKKHGGISKQEPTESGVQITFKDCVIQNITRNVYNVYTDYDARKNLEGVVAPLKRDGIDSFQYRDANNPANKEALFIVDKSDAEAFTSPDKAEGEQIVNEISGKMVFHIVSIVFDENQKWRFSDGDSTFWAKIADDDFWRYVEDGIYVFAKGDQLEVEYTIKQTVQAGGKSNVERVITKVIRKIPRPTQVKLDFEK